MELNEQQFIKGFNCGYILAEYEPVLLTKLLTDISPINSFIQGAALGQNEYTNQKLNDQLKELDKVRRKNIGDLERD